MTIEEIKSLFPSFEFQAQSMLVETAPEGLSHGAMILTVGSERLLLKVFQSEIPKNIVDYQPVLAKEDISAPYIAINLRKKALLFRFIEGEIATSVNDDLLAKLGRLHSLDYQSMSLGTISITTELSQLSDCKLPELNTFIQNELMSLPKELGCCHNDLVRENLITGVNGTYLIDFEYLAVNDVYFDLAAICVSFDLKQSCGNTLLVQYCRLICRAKPDFALRKLTLYRAAYILVCIQWYKDRGLKQKAQLMMKQLALWRDYIPPNLLANSL